MEDPQGTAVRDSAEGQIPARGWALLWAIALVSFSLMAYEIALSRLLSVLLSYHFAFAVLSLALLGLGLGGLLLHILEKRATNRSRMPGRLIHLGVASSVGIPISALLAIGLSNIPSLGGDVLWYLPPLIVPFVFGGAFLAEV